MLGFQLSNKDLEELIKLDQKLNYIAAFLSEVAILDKFPWLRHFPTTKTKWFKDLNVEALTWFHDTVNKKYKLYRQGERDDALGDLIKVSEDGDENNRLNITRKRIDTVARELIGAGVYQNQLYTRSNTLKSS